MAYEAYLQGSYANATNIRGNSDVDLVVQTDSVYYSNLTEDDKRQLGWQKGGFSWSDFRSEVLKALMSYYEAQTVDHSGDKSIRVLPSGNRLTADVIPCVEYRRYENLKLVARGMTFWTKKSGIQVVNYPKVHIDNGADKNRLASQWYKPSVRMFKNARERFDLPGVDLARKFPSYFIECLLYNVPDSCYGSTCSDTFIAVTNSLCEKRNSGSLSKFTTQSGLQWLFGTATVQWNEADAVAYISELVRLWNDS